MENVRENFSRVVAFGHPSPATVLAHPVSTISGTLDGVRCSCTVHHVVHIDVGVAHTSPVPLKVVPVMLPIGLLAPIITYWGVKSDRAERGQCSG